jgi:hypothetical protein
MYRGSPNYDNDYTTILPNARQKFPFSAATKSELFEGSQNIYLLIPGFLTELLLGNSAAECNNRF